MLGNWGCDGGFEEPAFNYIEQNGIMNESDYQVLKIFFNANKLFYFI